MSLDEDVYEATRQDAVALASIRLRRKHAQRAKDDLTWEAFEFLIYTKKLDQLLESYVQMYCSGPRDDLDGDLMDGDAFAEKVTSIIGRRSGDRPAGMTPAYFRFVDQLNGDLASESARAVRELLRPQHRMSSWDSDRASRAVTDATGSAE